MRFVDFLWQRSVLVPSAVTLGILGSWFGAWEPNPPYGPIGLEFGLALATLGIFAFWAVAWTADQGLVALVRWYLGRAKRGGK